MLKIKLWAVFAFLAIAAGGFLFSNNKSQAQTDRTGARRDEVLEKVADYKSWRQVQKPEKKADLSVLKPDAVTISDSAPAG